MMMMTFSVQMVRTLEHYDNENLFLISAFSIYQVTSQKYHPGKVIPTGSMFGKHLKIMPPG